MWTWKALPTFWSYVASTRCKDPIMEPSSQKLKSPNWVRFLNGSPCISLIALQAIRERERVMQGHGKQQIAMQQKTQIIWGRGEGGYITTAMTVCIIIIIISGRERERARASTTPVGQFGQRTPLSLGARQHLPHGEHVCSGFSRR
jgi:hypothetical protein